MTTTLLHGDCREVLRTLPNCSVDSVVTDPPYELGFMGKKWDASGVAYDVELWRECLRVLKPGGHLLAFGGTRTYHRMAVAIEDAGFEIRDSIHWLYGSGFPKSLDVSKAIDKAAGAEREVVGEHPNPAASIYSQGTLHLDKNVAVTAPATDAAKQWEGWGTALKPAHEPIVVARKPLDGTVATNVLEYGTGALNIDGCRVGDEVLPAQTQGVSKIGTFDNADGNVTPERIGRWPANVILDTEAGAVLDEQANGASRFFTSIDWHPEIDAPFRYVPKPSKRERNAGLDGLPKRSVGAKGNGLARRCATCDASVIDGCGCPDRTFINPTRSNHHPTVKPVAPMRWLVCLVTPPGGTVLEPFAGSGTTLIACVLEGFDSIGIELTEEYLPIIKGRVAWAEQQAQQTTYLTAHVQEALPL